MNHTVDIADDSVEGETISEWAARYAGVAMLGMLAVLLAAGKLANHHWARVPVLRKVVMPPAVVAGIIGCVMYHTVGALFPAGLHLALEEASTQILYSCISTVVLIAVAVGT
jgi:Na+/glutamate symporter